MLYAWRRLRLAFPSGALPVTTQTTKQQMQTRLQNTMSMTVPFEVPSTVAEFAAAAGVGEEQGEATVLKYASDEAMFRTILPTFRDAFFTALEEESGIERPQTGTSNKIVDGEKVEVPIFAKDTEYFHHVQAEEGKEAADYEALALQVAQGIEFNLRAKPRAGKPAKKYLTQAQGLSDAIAAGRGSWEGVVEKLTSLNIGLNIEVDDDGAPSLDALARALKVDEERRSQQAVSDLIVA